MDRYDILIIGGGQAGIPLAHALAKAGQKVALAERKDLGGSCVNFGCTPTKAVIASARAAFQARRGAVFGLRVPTVEVDFPAVLDRARSIVMQSRGSLQRGFAASENLRLLAGHARLRGREGDAFQVRVGEKNILAARIVLNTGARSLVPPIRGLAKVDYLHAGNWLDEHRLPTHLVFIGAGYIALEMSQFYLRMGCRVTVIEKSDQILQREDEDVVFLLQSLLESEGIEFRLKTDITRIEPRRDSARLC
jgi:pyruvate/2-oxoglutarate dehydrogenase complex dihydrolipoamide dehydrogenase (E3) component